VPGGLVPGRLLEAAPEAASPGHKPRATSHRPQASVATSTNLPPPPPCPWRPWPRFAAGCCRARGRSG
jgi:hypothetical protein